VRRLRAIERVTPRAAAFVELRIHGVSGTPPEALLDSYEVDQVRGDAVAGFFRRRVDAADRPARARDDDGAVVEAYSWGGLTSRSWTRALWVLLAPFALVNVAGWMLPPRPSADGPGGRRHRAALATVRLLGLLSTLLVVVWTCQVAMDFVAFQCGGSVACREGNGWVDAVFGSGWLSDDPTARVAVGALAPLLLLLVLRRLGRRSTDRYEDFATDAFGGAGPAGTFGDASFWRDEDAVGRFARAHVAAGAAVVATLVAAATAELTDGRDALVVAVVVGSLLVAVVAATVVARGPAGPASPARSAIGRLLTGERLGTAVLVASWVAVAVAVAAAVLPGTQVSTRASDTADLEVFGRAGPLLSLLLVVLVVVLAVALWGHPLRGTLAGRPPGAALPPGSRPGPPVGFGGFGAVVAALLGYGIAAVGLLGLASWVVRLLGGVEVVDHPAGYDAAAVVVVWGVLAIATPVVLLWTWRRTGRAFDEVSGEARSAFLPALEVVQQGERSEALGSARRRQWVRSIRTARILRVLAGRADAALTALVVLTYVALAPVAVLPVVGVDSGAWLVDRLPSWLVTAAVWVTAVGLPVGLFLVVRRSFSSTATRRKVGILWDVATFWPRWFHPLAPPCYSARAVPELQTRLDVLVGDGATVVLSAHSQGTLLALAALDGVRGRRVAARADEELLDHVGLLTYGSPITRLYQRYFPAHVPTAVDRVQDALGGGRGGLPVRWLNLYRATDPIGGAIAAEAGPLDPRAAAAGPPDRHEPIGLANPLADPDVEEVLAESGPDFPPRGSPYPGAAGHSGYERTAVYRRALGALRTATEGGAGAEGGG
jgi:hypothetical protein